MSSLVGTRHHLELHHPSLFGLIFRHFTIFSQSTVHRAGSLTSDPDSGLSPLRRLTVPQHLKRSTSLQAKESPPPDAWVTGFQQVQFGSVSRRHCCFILKGALISLVFLWPLVRQLKGFI